MKPVEVKPTYVRDIEERIMHIVGTKVNLRGNKAKGTIEIKYFSEDDLTRLVDLFQNIEE